MDEAETMEEAEVPETEASSSSSDAAEETDPVEAANYCTDLTDIHTPALGSPDCSSSADGKTVTATFAGCTTKSGYALAGTINLTFDAAATCDTWIAQLGLPVSGALTRTTTGFSITRQSDGSVWSHTSDLKTNYRGNGIGGGVTTSFLEGNVRRFEILGMNRTLDTAEGVRIRDHSIHTVTRIEVTGTRASGTRVLDDGVSFVNHNLAQYTQKLTLHNLRYEAGCCHPVSGFMESELSGTRAGRSEFHFGIGGCGLIRIERPSGISVIRKLPKCSPGTLVR